MTAADIPTPAGEDRRQRFGSAPLPELITTSAALRRLLGLLLSMEHAPGISDEMASTMARWERALTADAPANPAPRVGPDADEQMRLYLDHAIDIGAFNACFPEFVFDTVSANFANGRVNFPIVFEGPPGLVHGGFLGVFFDCVIQQHNCIAGNPGKTRSLNIRYRRPTPLLTELHFDITRTVSESAVDSSARITADGTVLCSAEMSAVVADGSKLPTALGRRRSQDADR
jgi:hypothetical protein